MHQNVKFAFYKKVGHLNVCVLNFCQAKTLLEVTKNAQPLREKKSLKKLSFDLSLCCEIWVKIVNCDCYH